MNRTKAKKILSILEAFVKGEEVQKQDVTGVNYYTVDELNENVLLFRPDEYRVKPRQTYQAFSGKKECWEEMLKHEPFGWIEAKSDRDPCLITEVRDDGFIINNQIHEFLGYDFAFSHFEFTDRKPFGKEI